MYKLYRRDRGLVFDFNERNDFFDMGNIHNEIFKTGTFSFSFWCNLRSHQSTEHNTRGGMLVSKWYSSDALWLRNSFIIYASGTFVSAHENSVTNILDESGNSASLPLNTWLHLAYVLEEGKLAIYINGEKQHTSNRNHIHKFSEQATSRLVLGILHHNKKYALNGMMDDFRLFDKTLTDGDVMSLYKNDAYFGTDVDLTEFPKIKEVKSGYSHSFLISEHNELYGFGRNENGQLGDSSLENSFTPKKVYEGRIKKVSVGSAHSIALTEDDRLLMTGKNDVGQIGAGVAPGYRKFTYIQKPEIVNFAAGAGHSLILNHKGNLMVTGKNTDGQLGTGNFRDQNTFLANNIQKVINVFAGAKNSYLLLSNGKLLGVGDNDLYQLADGTKFDRTEPVEVGNEAHSS